MEKENDLDREASLLSKLFTYVLFTSIKLLY